MYSQIFELQAQLLKALAHPKRLEVIQLLRDQELSVTNIHSMLDLPQANISQHLTILRERKVVKTVRRGKQILYSLSDPKIIQASDLLREVLIDQYQDEQMVEVMSFSMKDIVPLVHDPVCQMRVSPKTAGFHHTYDSRDFYFCASGCLKKFQTNPGTYLYH